MSDDDTRRYKDEPPSSNGGKTLSRLELEKLRILEAETRDHQNKLKIDKLRANVDDARGLSESDAQVVSSEADKLKQQFPKAAASITKEDREKYHQSRTKTDAERFEEKLREQMAQSHDRDPDRER